MRRIIVTGDSGGLGMGIVECLLEDKQEKYFVIGVSRKINENVQYLQDKYNGQYVHYNFDLNNSRDIKNFYFDNLKKYGVIQGLVNNSAYAYDDLVSNARIEDLEKMFNINIISVILLTKYFIRNLLLHGVDGNIVNISSVSASTGYKGLSMYAATKGALESFTRGIAREWGMKKIRANCVSPGFMETNMSKKLDLKIKNRIYSRNCLGKPTDLCSVAETVKFLLSEKSSSITGAIIDVDNGTI